VESRGQTVPDSLRAELLEYFAALAAESGLAPRSIEAYRRDLSAAAVRLHAMGRETWAEVLPEDLTQLLADRRAEGLAPASQMRFLSSLRGLYKFLIGEQKFEGRDPTRMSGKIHLWRRLPDVLGPEEARALLDAPPTDNWRGLRDRALLALLYGGGLRVSEACGLQLGDVSRELDPAILRVIGKGDKERLVPCGAGAMERVEAWLADGRPGRAAQGRELLVSRSGRPLGRGRAWTVVREWASAAGLKQKVHPHTLRHSCATHLLLGGGDLRSVQEFLGHADLRTTERYTHIDVDELQSIHRLHHPRG